MRRLLYASVNKISSKVYTFRDFPGFNRYVFIVLAVFALWLDIQAPAAPLWKDALVKGLSHVFVLSLAAFSFRALHLSFQSTPVKNKPDAASAPEVFAWKIQVTNTSGRESLNEEYTLKTGTLVIGRDRDCDICIPEKPVSRRHLKLVAGRKGLFAKDLKSANGTYVNGEKLEPKKYRKLEPGDVIIPADLKLATRLKTTGQ